ncbi:hypothetical protein BN13_280029 [Nostocoides jenkinsii Ben 74]|uniref:Uncharacterized protein n=1 Tax=Nostocoides jenkinsii Ben 74 TaxID=1193518 RepID=A0A077MDN9_9MICO|nr:hypothetical protein BN13_280029 [Tetrasphaera jenkinsii Ben 74]
MFTMVYHARASDGYGDPLVFPMSQMSQK